MSRKPHVVIINPDQWRGDAVGFRGTPGVQTPVLDRLVRKEAVAFTDAHCQHPTCTPSRCSFMTGWYPHTFGHRDQRYMLRDADATILGQLRELGYTTAWFGKNDLFPAENGLESYVDHYQRCQPAPYALYRQTDERRGAGPEDDRFYSFFTGLVEDRPEMPVAMDHDHQQVRAAVDFIAKHDSDQPLCLYLALHNPHPPYGVEEPFFSAIDRSAVGEPLAEPDDLERLPWVMREMLERQGLRGWSSERWRELRAVYYGQVLRIDHHLGQVEAALRAAGMWDDTLLLVFPDHGDHAGDFGLVQKDFSSLRTAITNVPLVVKPPVGVACEPGVNPHPAELTDVGATIYDLLGHRPRWQQFGRTLLPGIADRDHAHRHSVFSEGGHPLGTGRTGPAQREDLYWVTGSLEAEDHPAVGKVAMVRTASHAYIHRLHESDELYDLEFDPCLTDNRIDDPDLGGVLDALRLRMLDWHLETGDVVPPWTNRREP